jgi:hypothetical protein
MQALCHLSYRTMVLPPRVELRPNLPSQGWGVPYQEQEAG